MSRMAAKAIRPRSIRCPASNHRETADGSVNRLQPADQRWILAIATISECLRRDSDRGGP